MRNFATGGIEEESDGGFVIYSGGSGRTAGRGLGELGDCRACEKGEVKKRRDC